MRYLRSRLTEAKRYSPGTTTPSRDAAIEAEHPADWRQFLTGFFTAEGTFGVTVNGGANCFQGPRSLCVRTTGRSSSTCEA